jgi:hypothetical protein
MHKELEFQKIYYTYTVNNIGEYVITTFQINNFFMDGVKSMQGKNISYDMIFKSCEEAGKAIDNIIPTLNKKQ